MAKRILDQCRKSVLKRRFAFLCGVLQIFFTGLICNCKSVLGAKANERNESDEHVSNIFEPQV